MISSIMADSISPIENISIDCIDVEDSSRQTSPTDMTAAAPDGLGNCPTEKIDLQSGGTTANPKKSAPERGFQFWAIILALCIVELLSAFETTVVSTALPVIVHDLHIGENYIWITNAYFLTR